MPLCLATTSYGRKEGRSDLPATAPRISRPHRHTAVLPMDRQGKIRFSLPPSARGSSIEQLLADELTKGKGADILPWSAEVTAVTACPLGRALGEPTILCSQYG